VCGLKYYMVKKIFKYMLSHPSRVCGLKYQDHKLQLYDHNVAPFAGVWIEIKAALISSIAFLNVAPFAGVWIEIELRRLTGL